MTQTSSSPTPRPYDPQRIEAKWQSLWQDQGLFVVGNDEALGRPKYYVLDMFPYPSGIGLHVGHPRGYVASDIVARFKRMNGFSVLHPMGWDSFGLPTERQAEKEHAHPASITARNVATFRSQLKLLGLSYDWSREFATSDPSYYKWTQWIFTKMFEMGLAYEADVPVNWCPALKTILANEEVREGVYVETGDPVERRLMRQWMLRITAYAERLLNDLDLLAWPVSLKLMQRNWIGKSEGCRFKFQVAGHPEGFEVYSTRPETLFGCTFCVLAPEHPLVSKISTESQRVAIGAYQDRARQRSDRERISQAGEKTGENTGSKAINPVTGEEVPIWISDYVLAEYGTGAVFGCPGHDVRDLAFAQTFHIPVKKVISESLPTEENDQEERMVNSGFLTGLTVSEAKSRVQEWLEEHGLGKTEVRYALRDWLFSRQRYWGEPIPILKLPDGTLKSVPISELPVLLPDSVPPVSESDHGLTPLSRNKVWVNVVDTETGLPVRRETNTMPQWAGSSWYFLRFIDPHNENEAWSPSAERHWMPVDLYIGGAEHATLHLLYARFWHKVLFDLGYVSTPEPFLRLFNQGMVHSRSFRDARGKYYYAEEVTERNGEWFVKETDELLQTQIEKMSKSRNNGVAPEGVIGEYGADSLRIYEVFMGPMEESVLWQTEGLIGVRRFLDRVWRLAARTIEQEADAVAPNKADRHVEALLHRTIRKVSADIESLQLNTAVSQLMIFVNEALKAERIPLSMLDAFLRLLAPFAPHLVDELGQQFGSPTLLSVSEWPTFDPAKCEEDTDIVVVQVDGKLRDRLTVPRGSDLEQVMELARRSESLRRFVGDWETLRTHFVPGRILNIITK